MLSCVKVVLKSIHGILYLLTTSPLMVESTASLTLSGLLRSMTEEEDVVLLMLRPTGNTPSNNNGYIQLSRNYDFNKARIKVKKYRKVSMRVYLCIQQMKIND